MARRKVGSDITGKSCKECAVPDTACNPFNDCPILAAMAVAPYIKEARPTVRAKRPEQQPQPKICAYFNATQDCVFMPLSRNCDCHPCKVHKRKLRAVR